MNSFSNLIHEHYLIATWFFAKVVCFCMLLCSIEVQASENGLLFVYPEPANAVVKLLEKDQDYYPGMSLEPGTYLVQVSKVGYEKYQKRIFIESREIFDLFVELKKSSQWTDPDTGIQFLWIPEGCFEMGCAQWATPCQPDELPAHQVCVHGFWMSKYEITQDIWEKIMKNNPSRFQKGDKYPVEHVSWHQAVEFVSKLQIAGGYVPRLPTEAEWEYAARSGGRNETYAGGNDPSMLAWFQENNQGSTHPVGEKKANLFGLHDMSGNVWEWCMDSYAKDAYSQHEENHSQTQSVFRVRRGGSWDSEKLHLRTVFRGRYPQDLQFESNGVRILLEPD